MVSQRTADVPGEKGWRGLEPQPHQEVGAPWLDMGQ